MTMLAGVDPARLDPDRLNADELRQLEALLAAETEGESMEAFIRRVTPHHPPPRHLLPIIDCFERARHRTLQGGRPVRVCISMPPRHGKSETVFNGLAWWMSGVPADTHAYLSYSDDQATSQSRKIRQRAQEGGVALSSEMANLSEWRTTSGGGLFASGVGGALTGKGISGLAVVDDPFKGPIEANSRKVRENVWEWFTSVVMSRLEDASVMVVHTRWNEDDLIGRLAKEDGWEVINLPALADKDDPLGRPFGEPLWPQMRTLEQLLELKKIDAYSFEALYQGRPQPRGAKIFSGPPLYFDPDKHDMTGWRIILCADPAASKKTSSNWSAIVAMAVKGSGAQMRGRILDVYREQVTIPVFVRDLQAFQLRWGGGPVGVEAVAGFKAVPDILRDIDPGVLVYEIYPQGDKFQRAQALASAWNDGRVEVAFGRPWVKPYLEELKVFTGVDDPVDDQVDASCHCWNQADNQIAFELPDAPILPRRR